ncbi:MAG: hypothetical protein GWP64_09640 [Gammaproteobacteria bacterium]|nr:hypothetical protein [Gammaproteobacteria bacterium]
MQYPPATGNISSKSRNRRSQRDIAKEAPLAYKGVDRVVGNAHRAGLARKVARLDAAVCVKGEPRSCQAPCGGGSCALTLPRRILT